jgi:cytochrome c
MTNSVDPDKKIVSSISITPAVSAHPYNPKLLGPQWNLQDVNGKYIIQDFVAVAKDPGYGWTECHWNKPRETKPVAKKTFVMRVPGEEIFVGCGYYTE